MSCLTCYYQERRNNRVFCDLREEYVDLDYVCRHYCVLERGGFWSSIGMEASP